MASTLASYLGRRNVVAPAITVSTIQGSSISTASITTGALSLSTLTGSTISVSSIVFSSIAGSTFTTSTITSNILSLSTLTVSSINNGAPGVAAYSTLNVSSLNAMSSITTSTITASSITTASGYNSNIGNVLYTSLADSGQTAASFTSSGLPALAPSGTVISGSYRATAGASSGAIGMRLSSYTFVVGTTYNFTFTGMQGSQALALYVYQYNSAGNASTQISASVYSITTSAATVSGSFTPNASGTYTGTIVFYFQALAVNQYVNFTAFSMTTGGMLVGIGTSAPGANFHVYNSNSTFTSAPTFQIGDGQIDSGGTYGMLQLVRANGTADNKGHIAFIKNGISVFCMGYYPITGAGPLGLISGNAINSDNGIWLTTAGNVGIGTTAPAVKFHIYGNSTTGNQNRIQIEGNTTDVACINLKTGANTSYIFTDASGNLQLYPMTTSTQNVLLQSGGGKVGIGLTNPSQKLSVVGGTTMLNAGSYGIADAEYVTGAVPALHLRGNGLYGTAQQIFECQGYMTAGIACNSSGIHIQAQNGGNVYLRGGVAYNGDYSGGNVGLYVDSNAFTGIVGGSLITLQNSVNGGAGRGIAYWNSGDDGWASYMATSGGGTSFSGGTACTGAFGFVNHAIRNRVRNTTTQGFIWENSSETCLMSIRGDGAGGGMIGSWGVNTLSPGATLDVAGAIRCQNDWYYIQGAYGMYWTSYSRGFVSPEQASNNYGNVATWGTPRNTWSGWGVGSKACFMNYGNEFGLHDNSYSWAFYSEGGSNRVCKIAGSVQCSQNWDRLIVFVNGVDTGGGYFYVNQGGGYGMISDERIKKNIQPIAENSSMTFIKNLQPCIFCLKYEAGTHKHTAADGTETGEVASVCNCEQSGFIAQNVLASAVLAGIPKSVCNNWYDYEQELGLPDEQRKAILGVSIVPVVSHLTNAVKSLISQNTEQAAEIADLESQLDAALARLEALEAR